MRRNSIVEAIPIRDQVADIVRQMIIHGELKADTPISERQIADRLKVSTTPVKEAFRMLQTEGLIYSLPRKGSFISSFSSRSLQQVNIMRSALEGVAAFLAAQNANGDHLETMSIALTNSGNLLNQDNRIEELLSYNTLFHETIRCAAKNEYLNNLLGTLRSIDKTVRTLSSQIALKERQQAFEEHNAILGAIKNGNAKKSEKLMVNHVRRETRLATSRQKCGL